MSTGYVDYSVFSSDKFDARQYANSLLLSTTDRDEENIDFSSAENKLRFDLEEVESALKGEVETHWEELLDRTELAASTTADVAVLESGLESISSAYEKIADRSVVPYEEAEPLYDALVNLASTTALLRSLDTYLGHVSRLDTAAKDDISSATEVLLDLDHCVREHHALMQLRIVISNLPRVDSKKSEIVHACKLSISRYENLATTMPILWQLDRAQMMAAVKSDIQKAIEDAAHDFKIGLEVNFNIRRLQNSDNGKAVAMFCQNLKVAFEHMALTVAKLQTLEDECPYELLQVILDELCDSSASIKQYFWREISGKISSLTKEAIRNNQWVLRTLRVADIEAIVSRGLPKGTMEYSVVYGSLSRR